MMINLEFLFASIAVFSTTMWFISNYKLGKAETHVEMFNKISPLQESISNNYARMFTRLDDYQMAELIMTIEARQIGRDKSKLISILKEYGHDASITAPTNQR